jgi:hypothetical protein
VTISRFRYLVPLREGLLVAKSGSEETNRRVRG